MLVSRLDHLRNPRIHSGGTLDAANACAQPFLKQCPVLNSDVPCSWIGIPAIDKAHRKSAVMDAVVAGCPLSVVKRKADESETSWWEARNDKNRCSGHGVPAPLVQIQPWVRMTPRPSGFIFHLDTSKHKAGFPWISTCQQDVHRNAAASAARRPKKKSTACWRHTACARKPTWCV